MKKNLLFTLIAICSFYLNLPGAWAQETSDEVFLLEEVVVTSEKHVANLQDLPSSVVVLAGDDLITQGKITTSQILESVPNITFRNNGGTWSNDPGGTNPNGNIAIRGIQRTQNSGGINEILPASTGVYVDGVYQGIGGNYDLNRVEVLRGPQGTLYGRSATGGVVSFFTNDPNLKEFGGNATAEFGTASLINVQGAVNVPLGEKVALRASAHYSSRNGYYNKEGGKTETKAGRLKALFEPNDALRVVLSLSLEELVNWGGGPIAKLTGPNEVFYEDWGLDPVAGAPQKYRQFAVNADYDFGNSTLTWIGGYHDFDFTGLGPPLLQGGIRVNVFENSWPIDYYHSQEVRWASDTEGPLSWLVGANYFKHRFDTSQTFRQLVWPDEPGVSFEDAYMAPGWALALDGQFENYGFFTEETYALRDDFRITAGLRYDKTKLSQSEWFYFNINATPPPLMNAMNPPDYSPPRGYAEMLNDKHDYDNVTYKLRFEYDVTPDNMLYFLTATGFMPGYTAISPTGNPEAPWNFLMLDQQKLTNYEIGTKNQFLDDTLRLNATAFYYDYEGYPEAVNVRLGGGSPTFTVIALPLEVIGLEVEIEYLITTYDKISFFGGYLNNEIAEFPESVTYIPMGPPPPALPPPSVTVPGTDALVLEKVPGHPELKATLAYDHTFLFGNGSTLVPRAELVYTSDYYLQQMDFQTRDLGQKPYNHRDALTLFNIGATWTSANQMYSVTGYVRNAFDKDYKANVALDNMGVSTILVTPGDPRTFGMMVSVKF